MSPLEESSPRPRPDRRGPRPPRHTATATGAEEPGFQLELTCLARGCVRFVRQRSDWCCEASASHEKVLVRARARREERPA